MKKVFKHNFRGRDLVVEVGEMAKQATSSVVIRYGDTVVLSAVAASKEPKPYDFFPLMIVYTEKLYAVGKIPGGFIKREGRPTENATLTARLIDRPIRPLWPEGFRHDVQVVNTVLSVDQDNSPEMAAMFGSSIALSLSPLPFFGPIAGVNVGRVDGEFIINPTPVQLENSDINLIVAGTKEAVNMVEASSKEVSEEDMLAAISFGHEAIRELVDFQEKIIKELAVEKGEYELFTIDADIEREVRDLATERMAPALKIILKKEREDAINEVFSSVMEQMEAKFADDEEAEAKLKQAHLVLEKVQKEIARKIITEERIRVDGRTFDEVRNLDSQIDLLPRTHGSALFTRGETQSLSVTTLGALNEFQILDGLGAEDSKRFILHYNFPAFSVGETGRYTFVGRREVGHGALGEKALLQVMPSEEEFPYTIRVVSEVLESNGSSSQASICAACLSLMAAGVPIKAPVAGIAMGLISEDQNHTVLSDILGLEDHLGDMDFKVAGTRDGICALQMDIKILGLSQEILTEALMQAKAGRMVILDNMDACIEKPRTELSKYAPKMEIFTVKPEKIKDIIGRGGETITKIIQEASNVTVVNDINAVKVDLEDDGRVIIYHKDPEIIARTKAMIEEIIKEVEIGETYEVKVVNTQDFGAFCELWPGCEGLVHISQLAHERVNNTTDVVQVGDTILVKATGYDKRGKLNLSRKDVMPAPKPKPQPKKEEEIKKDD